MSLFVEHRGGLSNEHRVRSGTVSCIPLQLNLHFSGHGFWRLRRWGSAGSWVNNFFNCIVYFLYDGVYMSYKNLSKTFKSSQKGFPSVKK